MDDKSMEDKPISGRLNTKTERREVKKIKRVIKKMELKYDAQKGKPIAQHRIMKKAAALEARLEFLIKDITVHH